MTMAVYAYFKDSENGLLGNYSVADDGTFTVTVGNSAELSAAVRDGAFDSALKVSGATGDRITVKLAADITLYNNIFVTSDCHIDLGGKILYLNGYSVSFTHTYLGNTELRNGIIKTKIPSDKIYIDTPNNALIIDGITITDIGGNTLETINAQNKTVTSNFITVLSADNKYISYNAFYMTAEALINEIGNRQVKLDYSGVNSETVKITQVENGGYLFDESLYFGSDTYSFVSGKNICSYVTENLDLPFNYYGYGNVSVSYSGLYNGETEIISPKGKVTPQSSPFTGTLTAKLCVDGTEKASCGFTVCVISKTDYTDLSALGTVYLKNYLQHYLSDGIYVFNGETTLPRAFPYYGITYGYTASDSAKEELNGVILTDFSGVYHFVPTASVAGLTAVCSAGGQTSSTEFAVASDNTVVVKNDYTVAKLIANNWYGSEISIKYSTDENAVNNYSVQDLFTYADKETELTGYNISGLSYSLINNTDGIYEIYNNGGIFRLQVVEGKNPELAVQTVLLEIQFKYTKTTDGSSSISYVNMQIPVAYDSSSGSGSNVHAFLPYYNYYNNMLISTTGGYTLFSYTMPFCYGNGLPIVCYYFENTPAGVLSVNFIYKLSSDGAESEYAFSITNGTSMTGDLDNYLASLIADSEIPSAVTDETEIKKYKISLALSKIIAAGGAEWRFIINTDNIPVLNSNIIIRYNYKFGSGGTWGTYSAEDSTDYYSKLTVPGIITCLLKNGSTDETLTEMPDENLYKWVYDNFNDSDGTYNLNADYAVKFVLSDWLTQNIPFNYSSSLGVTNYNGIQYLRGTSAVNLTGSGISLTNLDYIVQMSSLSTLNLSNCSLSDKEGGTVSGADTDLYNVIAKAKKLEILYLNDNNIFEFNSLSTFNSVVGVYVYNNNITGINSIFYGSLGLSNVYVFQELTENGVAVYNSVQSGNPQLFSVSTAANDYMDLSGLIYQNKLSADTDIRLIYSGFSLVPSDYGVETSYTDGSGNTATVNSNSMSFGYEGYSSSATESENSAAAKSATYFTLDYTCSVILSGSTQTVSLSIKFKVERI